MSEPVVPDEDTWGVRWGQPWHWHGPLTGPSERPLSESSPMFGGETGLWLNEQYPVHEGMGWPL